MIFCKRGNLYPTGYRGGCRLFCVGRERSGFVLWQTSSRIIITTATEEKNEERRLGAATSNRISVYSEQRPLFLQLYFKGKEMARRYVGIDLAKRTMEVCIVEGTKIERHGLKTDEKGRKTLRLLLRKSDVAGYEVCNYGNLLARALKKEAGCEAVPLNAWGFPYHLAEPEKDGQGGRA
jgi:hypothetical protein